MKRHVISKLNRVRNGYVASNNIGECTNIDALEIHDQRLTINFNNCVYSSAMIVSLAHYPSFAVHQPEHGAFGEFLGQPVKRKLPLQVKEIPIEKVEVWLDTWTPQRSHVKLAMILEQEHLPQTRSQRRR
jgi:hypothetical protein